MSPAPPIALYISPDVPKDMVSTTNTLLSDLVKTETLQGFPFLLFLGPENLSLLSFNEKQQQNGRLLIDFLSNKSRKRMARAGKRELLIKAVSIGNRLPKMVLDATAGMGGDGFLLAAAGCTVTLCEQNRYMAALLEDGLRRAARDADMKKVCENIRLLPVDAKKYIQKVKESPEIIYLDPMFPPRSKSARVKHELALLQKLVGHSEDDTARLFAASWARLPKKIVVKRPVKSPPLCSVRPEYSLKGNTIRFDVYTPPSMVPPSL